MLSGAWGAESTFERHRTRPSRICQVYLTLPSAAALAALCQEPVGETARSTRRDGAGRQGGRVRCPQTSLEPCVEDIVRRLTMPAGRQHEPQAEYFPDGLLVGVAGVDQFALNRNGDVAGTEPLLLADAVQRLIDL